MMPILRSYGKNFVGGWVAYFSGPACVLPCGGLYMRGGCIAERGATSS